MEKIISNNNSDQDEYDQFDIRKLYLKNPIIKDREDFLIELEKTLNDQIQPSSFLTDSILITKKFFYFYQKVPSSFLSEYIDLISQILLKYKLITFLNIFISYYKFLNNISYHLGRDYVNNTIDFISAKDLIIKPLAFTKTDFSIRITSTSKIKFKYLISIIEKETIYEEQNDYYQYEICYGNYPAGDVIHLSPKNEGLVFLKFQKKIKLSHYDHIKENLGKCEENIRKNFILTKRNFGNYKLTYNKFKALLLNNTNIKERIEDILPYGSVIQHSQNIFSDGEITIITKGYQTISKNALSLLLSDIEYLVKDNDGLYSHVIYRSTKRTNLLSFVDNETEIKIELNLNNFFGVFNGNLIRNYIGYDSRAIILVNTIKDWSKRKGINGNYEGHLSSYCYTLMTIYFLQRINPPLLPIISSKNKGVEITIENKQYLIEKALINDIKYTPSKNTDPVSVLMMKWIYFYLYLFDDESYCIDITSREEVYRHTEIKYGNYRKNSNKQSVYGFIDMFDYSYNPGAYGERNSTPHKLMIGRMKRTLKQILNGNNNFIENDKKESEGDKGEKSDSTESEEGEGNDSKPDLPNNLK